MTIKKTLIPLVIFILLGVSFGFSQTIFRQDIEDWRIANKLEGNAEALKIFRQMQELRQKSEEKNHDEAGLLVSLAFEWKSLGEVTQDNFYFQKALEVYKIGIDKFGTKNVPFYWNGGKVAELMGDYTQAEYLYKEAIRIAPVYPEAHLFLTELYQYKLNKSPVEVLAAYAEGLKATQGEANVYLSQCSYLKRVDKPKAIECYQVLVDNLPNGEMYKEVIAELKK